MKSFFKSIGKGILYVLGFPFLIVGLCLAAVVGLFIFLFQFGKLIYLFFTGRTLFTDLDEDIKAKEILNRNALLEESKDKNNDMNLYPSNAPVYGSDYSSPIQEEQNERENIIDTNTENQDPRVEDNGQINLFEEDDHNDNY